MVVDLQFSTLGVYQAQVEGQWTILQFDEQDEVQDAICTCDEENPVCSHAEKLKKKIYGTQAHPLHVRFRLSLWNKLCQLMLQRIGTDEKTLKKVKGQYIAYSESSKRLFAISAGKKIRAILHERVKETEETSLKFSKLSHEEIALWKEGRPSFHLRYELSFWSDIAKYLFLLQEDAVYYEISFVYAKSGLPNGLKASFADEVQVLFYISEAALPHIIPTLATVKSPLKIISSSFATIEKILFEKDHFVIVREKSEKNGIKVKGEGIKVGDWIFRKEEGFYFCADVPLNEDSIPEEQVGAFLDAHQDLLDRFLVHTNIDREPKELQWKLSFDSLDELHVEAYLQNPGDLGQSRLFDSWLYSEILGFVKIEDPYFQELKIVVPKNQVSDFVTQNRVFLSHYEGFQTHLASVKADLFFRFKEDTSLVFYSKLDMGEGKDFGEWIYVKEEGFYAKQFGRMGFFIQPGTQVMPQEIPFFIHTHEEELEGILGFFSKICPIKEVHLSVQLKENETIIVTPTFTSDWDLKFFGDYVYAEGLGFHRIPEPLRLPEPFRQRAVIPPENIEFFLHKELPVLLPFISEIDPRLKKQKMELTLHAMRKTEEGFLSVELEYETSEGAMNAADLFLKIQQKRRYIFSSIGLIDLADPLFDWMRKVDKNKMEKRGKTIQLSALDFLRLVASSFLKEELKSSEKDLWHSFCTFTTDDPFDISLLQSVLRPYQEIGLKWLWFLYKQRLSGLLCDDMGLGKTHQAMALMAAIKDKKFLVVCPTSVIFHWQEKLQQFLPHLRVYTLHGGARDIGEFEKNFDILLTSYGILRIEQQKVSKIPFEIAIFDEVQVAKNFQSKIHKTLLTIQGRMKVGLTGTPIENRIRELKSLFDIVLPGFFPSEALYKELYVNPIEKFNDPAPKKMLNQLIKPFVLRRKKEDVLLELPEKTEELAFAELSEQQHELYRLILGEAGLVKEVQDASKPLPYTSLFALLTKLKQICDHPAVFLKEPKRYKEFQSGKWELFTELLEEARDSEQKVVVFSHYLGMLDIMQMYLLENNIGFAQIRGETQERGKELKRFEEDPTCQVFLGSLQAVGLGVDLTAASVVIHYDRWWNAARENQATDRVFRMGQKRGVQVFKLVTKETLEEYIASLIEKKGTLMEEIVGFDEESVLKQLTREEWLHILSQVPHLPEDKRI